MAAAFSEKSSQQIARLCREAFGAERVQLISDDHFRVDEEAERVVAFPHTMDELCEMLRFAVAERLTVIPAGAGTWLEMGNKPVRLNLILSTARMNRILDYEPHDLTATVEAGCTLTEFNARATADKLRIPLDPFGDERSTIGAIVATASSGPLRCAFGTPRDWVIGLRIAHIDGSVTKAGGKVVKNVAGYDLCKLYTGSFGTLGIISELSFKLRALPETESTMFFFNQDATKLCALASRLLEADVQPAALELFSMQARYTKLEYGDGRFTLAARFLNEPETIKAQIAEALRLGGEFRHTVLSEADATLFWRDYYEEEFASDQDIMFRVSVLPSETAAMLSEISATIPQVSLRAHAASGVIRVQSQSWTLEEFKRRERPVRLAELRQFAQSRGGQMVILRLPAELKHKLDAWGDVGQATTLMQSLKRKFDPHSLLNPGRFVAGI